MLARYRNMIAAHHTHILRVCALLCLPLIDSWAGGWGPAGAADGGPLPAVAKPPSFGGGGPHTLPPCSRRCAPTQSGMWLAASLARLPVGSPGCGRFFATSRAAVPLRLRLRPSPASGGSPRPRYRCSGVAVAGPLGCPPAPSLGPCAPLCGSVGSRCRPCALLPLAALRAPCAVALAALVVAVALRVGSPGPPVLAPFGASGPGPPRPGRGGPLGRLSPLRPGLFFVLGCCAPCAFPPAGGVLPLSPRPFPRWGKGSARPCWGACGPPPGFAGRLPRGCPSSRALSHCSGCGQGPGLAAAPPLPLPLRFFWRKALTKANICAMLI